MVKLVITNLVTSLTGSFNPKTFLRGENNEFANLLIILTAETFSEHVSRTTYARHYARALPFRSQWRKIEGYFKKLMEKWN